ncbi:MAG: 2-dehydro-3-deoxygalactonokinase [Cognatishimia sp.]
MTIQWIALDWGTTNLSAYAIDENGKVLERVHSDKGMSSLAPEEFEPVLLDIIEPWISADRVTPVIACGMVGAQQGWMEAPYSEIPCMPVDAETAVAVPTKDPRISVQIVPGLCQRVPEDVMRGEETQIAGYLAQDPQFSGVFCLPGTHSKWVRVENGEIQEFTTFMTGEMFGLLSNHSVLQFCTQSKSWDDTAYLKAVETAMLDPVGLTGKLFSLRPQALLSGKSSEILKSNLSGLLIGAELAATRKYWDNKKVVIIGDRENARLYHLALMSRGSRPLTFDGSKAIIAGLQPIAKIPQRAVEPA